MINEKPILMSTPMVQAPPEIIQQAAFVSNPVEQTSHKMKTIAILIEIFGGSVIRAKDLK
jgi:hypothetical protein